MSLPDGYQIKALSADDFNPLWEAHAPAIFEDVSPIYRMQKHFTEEERERFEALRANMGTPFHLRLAAFRGDAFAGWCAGHQESAETYYMRNSAVLPAYRNQGLYRAMLEASLRTLLEKGFQRIYSRHTATNNAVIIPKLKMGFVITALEVTDNYGVLVHLTYHAKAFRRQLLDYRVGETKPTPEIKRALGLE